MSSDDTTEIYKNAEHSNAALTLHRIQREGYNTQQPVAFKQQLKEIISSLEMCQRYQQQVDLELNFQQIISSEHDTEVHRAIRNAQSITELRQQFEQHNIDPLRLDPKAKELIIAGSGCINILTSFMKYVQMEYEANPHQIPERFIEDDAELDYAFDFVLNTDLFNREAVATYKGNAS